jgi:type II secretory pathway component PulM
MNTVQLTARGRRVVAWGSLLTFLIVLGFAGWIEGLS